MTTYKTCAEYLDYQQSGKCLIQCDACKKLDHFNKGIDNEDGNGNNEVN